MNQSTPIIILGMHRSGTSCLAGSLQQLGVSLGEVSKSNKYNAKGNRENQQIIALNDDILKTSGGDWKTPPKKIIWTTNHEQIRDKIINALATQNTSHWGFKDPRTLLTFDFWKQGLPSNFKIIGTFRHPLEVIHSLANRPPPFHVPEQQGLALWEHYNKIFLNLALEYKFPSVSFNTEKDEYINSVNNIIKQLNLKENTTISAFFDEELKHQKNTPINSHIPNSITELYNELLKLPIRHE